MTQASAPGFLRRLLSMLYESLMLIAVLFIASFIFHLLFQDTSSILFRPVFQLYLLLVAGIYFIWFWTHGGQTLPMQTWKLRVVGADGQRIYLKQAGGRDLFLGVGVFFFWLGIFWGLFGC